MNQQDPEQGCSDDVLAAAANYAGVQARARTPDPLFGHWSVWELDPDGKHERAFAPWRDFGQCAEIAAALCRVHGRFALAHYARYDDTGWRAEINLTARELDTCSAMEGTPARSLWLAIVYAVGAMEGIE